jgi:hypothetical protein
MPKGLSTATLRSLRARGVLAVEENRMEKWIPAFAGMTKKGNRKEGKSSHTFSNHKEKRV